jgi:hypothetical protein
MSEEDTRCRARQRLIQLQVPAQAAPTDQFWQGVAPLPRTGTELIHQPLTRGGIEHKVRIRHAPRVTDGRSPPQPKSNRPCHSAASFSQAPNPWRVDVGSRFGEADRVRRDRRERPRRAGQERDNRASRKTAARCTACVARASRLDLRALASVARRATGGASPGPEPGADAGPAAPQAPPCPQRGTAGQATRAHPAGT